MTIRNAVLDYMSENRPVGFMPTRVFKHHIPYETSEIRAELERLEEEGVVESDHSQANNTMWRLK